MHAIIALSMFLFVIAPVSGYSQESSAYRVHASSCLHVRSSPSTSASVQACLPTETLVKVLASAPYWRQVHADGYADGWVAKKYLEPVDRSVVGEDVPTTSIPADAWLEVHFVDVGQDDAIWIHTHDDNVDGNGKFEGYNIVIDGGPYSQDAKNQLLRYLETRGHHGANIEALILTHPHTDHFNGAETISRHFHIRDYYDPGYAKEGTGYQDFLGALRGANGEEPRAERLHMGRDQFGALNWGKELHVEVLYAWPGRATGLGSDKNTRENNASIVLKLQYGKHTFLLMGDAEGKERTGSPEIPKYVEKMLLDSLDATKLKSTVLKIAHHGSQTSSTQPFIQAVDPEIVVVLSGRKQFGTVFLPDHATLERYCCHNPKIRIYRTDQNDEEDGLSEAAAADGDHIMIQTNGEELKVNALEGGRPFEVNKCPITCSAP
jgi:competence protein ComEC